MDHFIGRKQELQDLRNLADFKRVCLVTVQGRRRIGKSRLIQEFAKDKRFLSFTGRTPAEAPTAQEQRNVFAEQLAQQLNAQPKTYESWLRALYDLSSNLTDEPTVVLFDEISWMATGDQNFVGDLKIWWDQTLKAKGFPNLMLIFCGSVSTWIEKNIIRSTSFFGRISLSLELKQLELAECAQFLGMRGIKWSFYDIFKVLAITGGIPRYLEEISPSEVADENIKRLCFRPKGFLATDFDFIFHDLFNGHSSTYKKIIHVLATGMKNLSDIQKAVGGTLDAESGDLVADVLQNLVIAGFVTHHFAWSIKTEKISDDYVYRLSDNYIRFYVKYIEQNKEKIGTGRYEIDSLTNLPGWSSTLGLHVENLLLNNRHALIKSLGINKVDIVADNPYIQRTSTGERGCQIDYLIQTNSQNLFVCEFKFGKSSLDLSVITEVEEKIKRLAVPLGFGILPVLFHLGEVTKAVYDKRYFYRIVDITDFLSESSPELLMAQGENKKAIEVAIQALAEGIPIETIARLTKLSIDEIKALEKKE